MTTVLLTDRKQSDLQQATVPSRRTLYRDLIISIVLVVAVVFAVVVSLAYGYLSHKAKVQTSATLSEFGDYLHSSLELPIWNIDEQGIHKICNSFFENTIVTRLQVTDHEGAVLFEKQRSASGTLIDRRDAITHNGAVVGYFQIALDPQFFLKQQRQLMWMGLSGLVLIVLVLAVTLRVVLQVFLLSPLNQLIKRTDQISRGEYDFSDLQAPQEEIRAIASRFNTMSDRIRSRERSLKRVNLRLEMEIEKHKDAQMALLNSQEELHSIIRSTPDVIYRLDTMGRFTFVSDAIRRYGVTPDELIGRPFLHYVHPDDAKIAADKVNQRDTGRHGTKRLAIRAFGNYSVAPSQADQTAEPDPVFLIDAEGLYVSGESEVKVFVGTQGIAKDITEQRQIESARLESEDRLLLALDVSGAGIWQLDLKTGSILVDERIATIMGYAQEDLIEGLPFIREKTAPKTWQAIENKFTRHVSGDAPMFDHEFQVQSSQGQWRWFHTKAKVVRYDTSGQPETMVGIVLDTSDKKESDAERERLEMKLQQAQKMEAIGTLAGGIAHDFNNILGAILGYAQLTQMKTVEDSKVQGYVDNIFKASERAKGLVEQILTFTRQGKSQKMPSDIATVLKEVVKLLRATIPSTIEIVQQTPSNLGTVMADQTQIHQVVMNLCTNAAHAMEAKGGRLTVRLENQVIKASPMAAEEDLLPGRYLKLSVGDTGAGMDKEVIDRIFDPYYTTKSVGEGTGMGLATVHGIVNDHGGRVFVESSLGEGSVFSVFLPVLEDPVAATPRLTDAYTRGTERILFVDDEALLVEVGVEMLKDLGYDARGATRPDRALEMFQQQPDAFDLVITDMTMPGMTGDQLAREMLTLRPQLPVIICTGFSKRVAAAQKSSPGIRALLLKPITVQELSRTVREVLDHPDVLPNRALQSSPAASSPNPGQ